MKPEKICRREMVKIIALGPATFLPLLPLGDTLASAQTRSAPKKSVPWKPKVFTEVQNQLVITIAELIIPETETPGARAAKANEHIDLVLSEETPEVQRPFLDGLAWINQKSNQLYKSDFLKLSAEQQVATLTLISDRKNLRPGDEIGHDFFLEIRQRTVFAYYTSEIGIHEELTYKGKQVLDRWVGCPHPDHHGDSD